MHRFYLDQGIDSDVVAISDAGQLHHLKDVLRLRVNDGVIVFDREGNEYTCLITGLSQEQAVLAVTGKQPPRNQGVRITVACAIPKGTVMDEIVDYLTQLDVDGIIPLETERVIARLDEDREETKLRRWQRIARNAARQSQRRTVPLVEPVTSLEDVLSRSQDFDLKLMPTLSGEREHIKEALARSKPRRILVLIGPEGDFTPGEVEMAVRAGFIPVSLGEPVLRVATAVIAVAGYLRFSLND